MFRCFHILAATALLACPSGTLAAGYPQDALCVDGSGAVCDLLPADMPNLTSQDGYSPSSDAEQGDTVNQQNFDYFGWQMFVALNWPADETGKPSGSILGDAASPRVWQFYDGIEDVFPGTNLTGATCPTTGRMVLSQTSKLTSSSFIEPFTTSPLIDSAGNFVMYDIRLNDVEATYLRANGLTTIAGQTAFGKPWDLPRGLGSTPGAIEIKTSWRLLPEGDNPMGYFTQPATVIIPAKNSETGQVLCLDVTAGLVGMHIIQKITNPTAFSDFWVWATFEHAQNAPVAGDALVSQLNKGSDAPRVAPYEAPQSCSVPADAPGTWAFFNAACQNGSAACEPNAEPVLSDPAFLWRPSMPYAGRYLMNGAYGTQVTRCWEVYDSAKTVDKVFQQALDGSVWANYNLVGVQWAQSAIVEYPDPLQPFSAPVYLVNTTLETYLQTQPVIDPKTGHPNTNASGSCITCHDIATDRAGNKSNFSFLGGYAN